MAQNRLLSVRLQQQLSATVSAATIVLAAFQVVVVVFTADTVILTILIVQDLERLGGQIGPFRFAVVVPETV